jgi:hypothetical protein
LQQQESEKAAGGLNGLNGLLKDPAKKLKPWIARFLKNTTLEMLREHMFFEK